MSLTEQLKKEMSVPPVGKFAPAYFRAQGYKNTAHQNPSLIRADGIYALFTLPSPHIYPSDLIVGSFRPYFAELSEEEIKEANETVARYPERDFWRNADHFAPDYETAVTLGIPGLLAKIEESEAAHADDGEALAFLASMRRTLLGLQKYLLGYAERAAELQGADGYSAERLAFVEKTCREAALAAPTTFAAGLQLVFAIHECFCFEGRYAMAIGRIDQFLYPLFQKDTENGTLTEEFATELLENAFMRICERHFLFGGDDVVNICVGGVDPEGEDAVNRLSYLVVDAVQNINMPGPNLSARIAPETPDAFLDRCLISIGTGLGYPALMNDTVNMAALSRYSYAERDVRNYCMVGCIENFITGTQPPWSDGRFDTPRFLEYVLFDGEGYDKNRRGIKTAPLSEITTMEKFMACFEEQLAFGAEEYVNGFCAYNAAAKPNGETSGLSPTCNALADPENYTSPFLSCFCRDCIGRAKDINMGGTLYPSVHGAALMGVGTLSDSLAAIEKVVFIDREATLTELADALRANFEGYEKLREKLLAAPKYGNNDDFVDKYAVWFTRYLADQFDRFRTPDGGWFYIIMAANTSNIWAGRCIGATPDGRLAAEPLSDAASPTYGRDTRGATSTLLSVSKPDYTRCACGSVVNQKYPPSMFEDGKREKLLALIRVYFARGGQEIQINATSTDVLRDAMENPQNYGSLVVRVSGFSAFYVTLDRSVQEDILQRTQQE